METPEFMLLCALIVVFASTAIISLIKVAALFKRSQQWGQIMDTAALKPENSVGIPRKEAEKIGGARPLDQ